MKKETNKIKYPAPYLAHWVTGAVACCEEHCNQIVGLGRFVGSVVPVSKNEDETAECSNCISEAEIN